MSERVQIVVRSYTDDGYRHEVGEPMAEARAEKVTLGLLRNMHDDYYVDEEPA